MPEKKEQSPQETGMCPHGNFPDTCEICNLESVSSKKTMGEIKVFDPQEYFDSKLGEGFETPEETEKLSTVKEMIDDSNFAETFYSSVRGLRERSQEMLNRAKEIVSEDPSAAKILTAEALIFEHQARRFEAHIARDIERIQKQERQGMPSKRERRGLKIDIAEAYVASSIATIKNRYEGYLQKVGIKPKIKLPNIITRTGKIVTGTGKIVR